MSEQVEKVMWNLHVVVEKYAKWCEGSVAVVSKGKRQAQC